MDSAAFDADHDTQIDRNPIDFLISATVGAIFVALVSITNLLKKFASVVRQGFGPV